ncbi:hypothetical protein EDC94DRAFT_602592 [Helicostylum pulchrum]|nr:hypothetical protein EDC94DRAFT_602592 [Helicostylum pulchrum]
MYRRLAAYCIIGSFIAAISFQLLSYVSFEPLTTQYERYQRDYSTLGSYITLLVVGTSLTLLSCWFQQHNYKKRKLLGQPTIAPPISLLQRWALYEWRLLSSTWSLLTVGKLAGLFLLNTVLLYKDLDKVVQMPADSNRNMYLQTLANRSAQLAITNIAVSVALSAKLSVIQRWFFSIDTTLQWHKWFGRLGFLQVMYHATYQLQFNYARQGGYVFATLTTNVRHVTGTCMMSAMVVLILGSHPVVRLLSYRLFRWTHLSAFFVLVLFGCLHHWSFYLFYGAVLVFWVTDQVDRSFVAEACTVESLPGEIVKLTCKAPYQSGLLIPGQFAFISFGSTSWIKAWFHSHPFSICRMDSEVTDTDESALIGKSASFTFYIKSIGNETRVLYQLGQQNKTMQARISRPMGRPYITNAGTEFGDYDTIVLVAEGMGITPWISVLHYIKEREHAIHTKSVYFIWTVRSIDTFYAFEKEFERYQFTDINVHVQLFITGVSDPEENYSIPSYIQLDIENRPDYEAMLLKVQQKNKETVLGICTHEETMVRVNNIGLLYSWAMKKERFEL